MPTAIPWLLADSHCRTLLKVLMKSPTRFLARKCLLHFPRKNLVAAAFALLLAACGSNAGYDDPAPVPTPTPSPSPVPVAANTVVATASETAELTLYVGQARRVMLQFRTVGGGTASGLELAAPAGDMPAGWTTTGNATQCGQVDSGDACGLALDYAPTAATASSVLTLPFTYRNNQGESGAGNVAIAYRALAANAAVAVTDPAGPVRGVVGKASLVNLVFTTNDESSATELHLDDKLDSLPDGWSSDSAGLDCAAFGAGNDCRIGLRYTPAASMPASALALRYRYRDSSGALQSASTAIAFSAVAPNTVIASSSPGGVIRARPGASQQVTIAFLPSDSGGAGKVRLVTDLKTLPPEWTLKSSVLPCAQADSQGNCAITLVYTPGKDQPAGKLELDYAYTDAVGRELAGKVGITYASRDFRAYIADFGGVESGALVGGVRQCERDSQGKLSGCVKADGTWPGFGANNVVVYDGHAYIGSYTKQDQGFPAKAVTVCDIADDNALTGCAESGPTFDQMGSLQVGRMGVFVLAVPANIPQLTHCALASDGRLDTASCNTFPSTVFGIVVPTAMTGASGNFHVSASNFSTVQNLYSCTFEKGEPDCSTFPLGQPKYIVQRMSQGQAGGKPYLYLAASSLSDPQKAAGTIVKCALDANNAVAQCDQGSIPAGLAPADLIRISDIRVDGSAIYLVTGPTDDARKVYQCPLDQQTGDLGACIDAGDVPGLVNSAIALR